LETADSLDSAGAIGQHPTVGLELDRESFEEADVLRFTARLRRSTHALRLLLERPGFGVGETTIGAELELHLVDDDERPALVNRAVLAQVHDDRVALEADRFNLEVNAKAVPLRGSPFTSTATDLNDALAIIQTAAKSQRARAVMIGILPTLVANDLTAAALTDGRRYRVLSAGLRALRHEPFQLHLEGADELRLAAQDVAFEGANTSFQVHLRTSPAEFAATLNAAQLATGVTLACSGNSPLFCGKRLWDETRIGLFRQAVDERPTTHGDDWRSARVSFGHGWVRHGALELFEEAIHQHAPVLPVCSEEDPLDVVHAGGVPTLGELRLHHGTVWRWNRAVFDPIAKGHLRVELRALPAGPTVADMMANAAMLLGLTLGLRGQIESLLPLITFGQARRNFYEAARRGLDAELLWPARDGLSPRAWVASALALHLVPLAREGLISAGVTPTEAEHHLEIFEARVEAGITGARWQRTAFDTLMRECGDVATASQRLVSAYREHSELGLPVHSWPSLKVHPKQGLPTSPR
jgi:hypothetical protein